MSCVADVDVALQCGATCLLLLLLLAGISMRCFLCALPTCLSLAYFLAARSGSSLSVRVASLVALATSDLPGRRRMLLLAPLIGDLEDGAEWWTSGESGGKRRQDH